jgi:hypothetical protein
MKLIFDIETAPDLEMVQYLPEIEAPGNYKDPSKIGEYITRAKDEQIAKMALDPDFGKITTVSFCVLPDTYSVIFVRGENDKKDKLSDKLTKRVSCQEVVTEAKLLGELWYNLDQAEKLIGYNILEFDLPFIMRRSMVNGVKPPFIPNLAKFRSDLRTMDLFMILNNWKLGKGLKTIRNIYGLTNAYPEIDGITGAEVNNQPLELRLKYAINDVVLTKQLYYKMNGVYFS